MPLRFLQNCSQLHFLLSFSFLSNLKELSEQYRGGYVDKNLMPVFNYSDPSSVAVKDYGAWFKQYGNQVPGNLTECDLEREMQKVKIVNLL